MGGNVVWLYGGGFQNYREGTMRKSMKCLLSTSHSSVCSYGRDSSQRIKTKVIQNEKEYKTRRKRR